MNCPNCNTPLEDNAKFCENCGAPITAPEVPSSEEMLAPAIPTKKKPSKIKWIVLIVVGVLIIAGISVGVFFKVQADKKVKQYSEQISLGEKYLEELKYDDAVIAFTKAIEIEPKKEKPYFALVDVYIETKDTEKANEIIAQIETLFPENVDVVDKQEEVAVIVEEIKAEEEKKKAEEEAAKKAKELKWIVPPDREYFDLAVVNSRKYGDRYVCDNNYDQDVLILTNAQERLKNIGIMDYNGNVLFEPDERIYLNYGIGLTMMPKTGAAGMMQMNEINPDGTLAQPTPIPMHMGPVGPLGEFVISTGEIAKGSRGMGESLKQDQYGVIYAIDTPEMFNENETNPKYVALGINNKRITQDVYDNGLLGTENSIAVSKGGKWGFIKDTGEEMIPFEYDDAYYFQGGLAAVCKADKWGYIKPDGTVQKDFQFEQALPPYEGKAWVKYNGKWGVLDMTADGSAKAAPAKVPEVEETPAPEVAADDLINMTYGEFMAIAGDDYETEMGGGAMGYKSPRISEQHILYFPVYPSPTDDTVCSSVEILLGGKVSDTIKSGMSYNEISQIVGAENLIEISFNYLDADGYHFTVKLASGTMYCDIDTQDKNAPTTKILYKLSD